jgi:hypothetical protein
MGGIDIANQHRAAFTTLQHRNNRYWKPLFYWLLDIALVNSYLLASALIEKSRHQRDHRKFQEALAKALMTYSETPEHNRIQRPSRTYCAYCRKNQTRKLRHQEQAFGANITNIGDRFRGSSTYWGCEQCNIALCKLGDCWHLWHKKFN